MNFIPASWERLEGMEANLGQKDEYMKKKLKRVHKNKFDTSNIIVISQTWNISLRSNECDNLSKKCIFLYKH